MRAQEGPDKAPRGAQEGDQKFKHVIFSPERAPEGPKRAPRGPKRPPRGPQQAPKRLQEAPKLSPKRLQNCCPEAPERRTTRSQRTLRRPLSHNQGTVAGWGEGPRRLPEAIQRLPRSPATPSISPQESPTGPEGTPWEAPRGSPRHPTKSCSQKAFQERDSRHPDTMFPKGPLGTWLVRFAIRPSAPETDG